MNIRVYNRYPVVTVTIYDRKILVSPVLFKRRAKDSMTAIYRKPSSGAEIYEEHFDKVFELGSSEITPEYIDQLRFTYKI